MAKYHISADGTPGICRAKEGNCPLGGSENHYNSKEEAYEAAQAELENEYGVSGEQVDTAAIDKEIEQLKEEMEKVKGGPRLKLRKQIRILEYKKEGRDYEAEMNEKNKKMENFLKEKEEAIRVKSKEIADAETIEVPEGIKNFIIDRPFNRNTITSYRGEMEERAKTNSGTAMYGQGRYTTTNRSYASKFGKVRHADVDEMPTNPLRLQDATSFSHLEHEVCREYGMPREGLYRHMDVQDLVTKMGYDGLTIGPNDDMIIVKY